MTKKEMRAVIKIALDALDEEIRDLSKSRSGSMYAAGLSSEGYSGGYREALWDMELLLNGVIPSRRHYYNKARVKR